MPLRIAQVTATFPPYRGGTGTVCFQNARELSRRGHNVHVFTAATAGAPQHARSAGITIHRLRPLLRIGNAPALPTLLPALRGFDIIHLHYPFFGGEIAALAAWRAGTPLVITYHQDVLLHGLLGLIERGLRWSVGRMALRAAARVLFTSADYGRASYIRPLLADRAARLGALSNGVDVRRFTPDGSSAALRARHQLTAADRVVLLVAGLDRAHYFKGVNVLLSALTHLPAHVRAVIVGDGDLRPSYAARAAELGLAGRVHFAGRVDDDELADYYRLADVTVLPSVTMGEAFGLVLVESLASETPVIASDLPGVRTVVDHGRDGLLVAPGDPSALAAAIRRIVLNGSVGPLMGRLGRQKVVERYDWRQIGAQLEAIYVDVLAQTRPDPRPMLRGGR